MAKKAWIERDKKKRQTVEKYAALRTELKAKRDYAGLAKLPRNDSPTRAVNRCRISGRRRGISAQVCLFALGVPRIRAQRVDSRCDQSELVTRL